MRQTKNHYNKIRNLYDRMIKTKKQSYIKSMFQESKNNSRATWKIINQLIGKKKQKSVPSLPCITNQLSIANHFNRYFTSVADNLVKNIKNTFTIEFKSYLKKNNQWFYFLLSNNSFRNKNNNFYFQTKIKLRY